MEHFDCDVLVGAPRSPLPHVTPGPADLRAEMERLGIRRVLARHRACDEVGPVTGNAMLRELSADNEALVPAWSVTPDTFLGFGSAQAEVERMLADGFAAAWMKPTGHDFCFEPWCVGRQMDALQERRVPLVVAWDDVTGDQLDRMMAAFPELPLILLGTPRMGRNRTLYPLLERHRNLHAAVTPTYSVYRGLEDLCAAFGPHRFLFGTGYPEMEGGAAVCMLSYAEISEADRAAIASGNLDRLLREVRR